MLNGIGGNTIEEAKRNISIQEGSIWARYMHQRGTLNIARKLEQTVGLFTALYVGANSKDKVDFSNYMPHEMPHKPAKKLTQAEKIKALFNKIGTSNE